MSKSQAPSPIKFKAEVSQLLNIMASSIYTNKEIFIREVISNASDALNKLYYLQLVKKSEILDESAELRIDIEIDKKSNTLTIKDTGIGMTRDDLINNIGTIAQSGTKKFLEALSENKDNTKISEIIGQFGVGFYSCFVVAEKVEVLTRSYIKDEKAYLWTSEGKEEFTITEAEKQTRGTEIKIYLKDTEKEFLEKERIKSIIQKYSNFLKYPIFLEKEQVNTVSALWTKHPSRIEKKEYDDFYKFFSHTSEEPLFHIHKAGDAPIQFNLLLFCPAKNYNFYFDPNNDDYGLALYVNKVLIIDKTKDLLPRYFRFLKGIVDSADIPLNISRENIQDNLIVTKIKNIIIKAVLEKLEEINKEDKEKYIKFYKEFNREFKDGLLREFEYSERYVKLLMFNSSKCEKQDELINLDEYIERKHKGQKNIYYITGENREKIEKSPYIEIFKKKEIDVLYLYDPMDEILLTHISKYQEMDFVSIDKADIEEVDKINKSDLIVPEEDNLSKGQVLDFLKFIKETLKEKTADVIESKRLTDSVCCLVNPKDAPSAHIEKIMKMMNQNAALTKKILEINTKHPLIKNLAVKFAFEKEKDLLKDICYQLYDNALLMEGNVPDLTSMADRIEKILEKTIEKI